MKEPSLRIEKRELEAGALNYGTTWDDFTAGLLVRSLVR
jgi:hypothetical protein